MQSSNKTSKNCTRNTSTKPLRNIGISAHIDAGKTTLSERILFYAGKIRRIGEVHDASAAMDTRPIERERGITIHSAATQVAWSGHAINLIDTPGHVDFTVEVERALSVLDGAVLVLCGVAGVQAQTLTVDRQIRRHELPRLVFINKLDRPGADAEGVLRALRARMSPRAVFINFPLYLEDGGQNPRLVGVVDVVTGQALRFAGTFGETVEVGPCPPELLSTLHQAREQLLETLAEVDDTILADLIDGVEPSMKVIKKVIRQATIQGQVTPVLCGSAYHQVGVQPLLDAVVAYLPAPEERTRVAESIDDSSAVTLDGGIEGALCAFAFKVDDGDFGQLTYVRIIQGKLVRGMRVVNTRTGKRLRIGRLGRMHAATMEELQVAYTGDIVVVFGLACGHGDTLTDGELRCSLSPIVVPDPVMAVAISQRTRARTGHGQLAKALGRFVREDPSFRVHRDPESGETIISGMGELHLEVYIERLRREHGLEVEVSAPEVAYRESIARPAQITHTHKKQDGGHGQYARVQGSLRPTGGDAPMEVGFTASIRGGAITKEYLPACEQGFADALKRGILIGAPVLGVTLELVDGATHEKDSSPLAFRLATRDAVRAALRVAEPIILEPVMEVEVTTPTSHHGNVVGSLVQRRGRIMHHESTTNSERIVATVPLAEMFGYAGHLRSLTQGQGCFSMHFAHYGQVPSGHVRALIERFGSRAAR